MFKWLIYKECFINGIRTNINFCGKIFCTTNLDYDPIKNEKYVTFKENDVKFFLGAEGAVTNPVPGFGTKANSYSTLFPWGMDLMRNVINNTTKYLKFAYYGNILDCNDITGKCGKSEWLIKDQIDAILQKSGITTYVIQKPTKMIGMVCHDPQNSEYYRR